MQFVQGFGRALSVAIAICAIGGFVFFIPAVIF